MFPQKHNTIYGLIYAQIRKAFVFGFLCFVSILVSLLGIYTYTRTTDPSKVFAATSSNLNFQGRLLTSSGGIVPDGYYNIEFKLYDGGTDGGPGGVGEANAGTNLWTETYYDSNGVTAGNDNRVRIVNGYFSVNLGSQTAFGATINWDQELWLTMNVGGSTQTATPTWDGEMLAPSSKRTKLTAIPYAFVAGRALAVASNNTNAATTNSSNVTIQSGNAAGATSNSGNITMDVGTATQTAGTISIGTANQTGITIGRSGVATTLQGAVSIAGGTNYGVYYRDGSGNVVTTAAGTSGECFKANTGAAPTWGSCTGTGDFIQGGNAFSANAVLGTNDNYALELETNGTTRAILQADGDFEVDTNTFFVDAANNRVGIGDATPSYTLDVNGDINTTGVIRISGTSICTSTGCVVDPTSGIQNQSASDQTADFRISGTGRANTSITTPLLDSISGALSVGTSTATGVTIGGTTNTTSVLLQGAANATYTIGTANNTGGITIGNSTASNTINIGSAAGSGNTQTIYIGTSATAGSTTNVTIGSTIAGITTLQSQGGVAITTLGSADTATYICRNSSNLLASCNTTGAGAAFVQGGNTFGATAVLGTNDNNSLSFETNNNVQATIAAGGATVFKNSTNSTSAFTIQNATSVDILTVDSTNSKITLKGNVSEATLGAELVTSQDFTNGTYWSCAGWTTSVTDATHNTGNTNTCTATASNLTVSSGAIYQVEVTYSATNTDADYLDVSIGGESAPWIVTGSGTMVAVIETTTTGALIFTPTSDFDGTISNISVKLLTPSNTVLSIANSNSTVGLEVRSGGSALNNTYIGLNSGRSNTTGDNNTALGAYSLQSNTSGYQNTAVGKNSLFSNTTGYYNTALGNSSLYWNTTGYYNTAIGKSSLSSNTSGNYNTALGVDALSFNLTGSRNLSIGYSSLSANLSGSENTALGDESLANSNGDNNTAVGRRSLYSNTTGTANLAIGYYAGYIDDGFATSNNLQNASAIGAYSQVQQSDSLVLGRSGSGSSITKVGIGTTAPTDLFSISPTIYDTGTAGTGGVSSTTVTGSGTTWTSSMVGMEIIFSDGTKATVTAFGSATSLTVSPAITVANGTSYRIHNRAFYVTSTGSSALRTSTNSSTAFQIQNASGAVQFNADTTNGGLTLGSSTGTGTITIGQSSATNTITIGSSIGGSATQTIYIGTSSTASSTTNVTIGSTIAGITTLQSQGGVSITTLGTANTDTILCRNGSNIISTCSSTFLTSSTGFLQNGNSFSATATIGTNDNYALEFETFGSTRAILQADGDFEVDSTTLFVDASNNRIGINTAAPSADLTFGDGATRTINVLTRTSNAAGSSLTITAGAAGSGASAFTGGTLTLQGGAAGGTGNAVGGSVTLVGGAGIGTGVQGLVNLSTSAFTSASTQSFAVSGSLTSGLVDQYSTIPVNATATNLTVTIPSPHATNQIIGRLLYITAVDNSNDFTLSLSGTSITIVMKENSTATLIWNGTGWTAAGASSSTDLQSAYNNTIASAGGAELVLNASGGAADGLTVRNNATTPITGGLLEVQTSIGSNLFTVNNNATEYATNGGAETAGASSSTFPSSTWDTTTGGTVDRYTTVGDNVATGQASVRVQTTASNEGARNRISASLTSGLTYTVSFAVRGATNFSTLQVLYSPDGTTSGTTQCATAQTVTTGQWTRITCSFVASGTITSSNSILIRQTDATARTFYVDNLSINVNASATYAADGSVDSALGTNWTNFGTLDSLTRETTIIYDTSGSVAVNTPNSVDRGVRNNLPINPAVSTQYLVTFYARSTDAFNDIRVRYTRDGGTNFVSCVDYNTQTVSTSAFTEITCLFTTDSTTPTDPDIVIDQPTASDRTFYIDALSVTLNTNNSNNVQVGGANKGGPVTLFTLDRSAGAPIAANNEAYLGSMYYDTSTGRIQCYEADGWGACGAAPDNIVNLNPEYAGAVLNGTGVGTMTADFCSDDTALTVNASLCETGEAKNYYRWTSPQATQQTYSIYVTYQLPATFNGFSSDDTVQLVGRVDNTSNAAVTYQMFKSTGSAVTQCGSSETTVAGGGSGSANVWYSVGINGNESTGCSFTSTSAGDFIIFKINLKANSNANSYVSTLSFTTTGR